MNQQERLDTIEKDMVELKKWMLVLKDDVEEISSALKEREAAK